MHNFLAFGLVASEEKQYLSSLCAMGEAEGGMKKRVRLSTSQLYDLYSRLDINGDGELDMAEFMDVGKKLDFEDENMVVRAFRHADTSSSGKLDAEEFLAAYDALISGDLQSGGDSDESFVRATRYHTHLTILKPFSTSCALIHPTTHIMAIYTFYHSQ